jgi:hypothetical protein
MDLFRWGQTTGHAKVIAYLFHVMTSNSHDAHPLINSQSLRLMWFQSLWRTRRPGTHQKYAAVVKATHALHFQVFLAAVPEKPHRKLEQYRAFTNTRVPDDD